MIAFELKNIAIFNQKGADYRCTKNDPIKRLNNSKLDDKSML